MAEPAILSDVLFDFVSDRVVVDTDTGDAAVLSGPEVIVQDALIRLQTQLGTVKRQGRDDFGFDLMNRIKNKTDIDDVQSTSQKITEIVLQDERILDADVSIKEDPQTEDVPYTVTIKVENEQYLSFPFLPQA